MEEVEKHPEEASSEPSALSGNQEAKSGVSTQEIVEFKELWESQIQEEEEQKLVTPQWIANLQRDLSTSVTNIQTAADAKESMQRTELEEARRLRLERLENDVKSSQEKFEEITRGWSIAKQKVILQELQEALNDQQQLCAVLIEDKKKLINYLQQELKAEDDRYVKDLRKQAEELDLMMERMEDQIKTLTKAYREELAQIQRVYQQESEVLLTRDKTEWEQHMKELWERELDRLTQRKKKVEEYEATIHSLMLETTDKDSPTKIEQNAKLQFLERETQLMKTTSMLSRIKQIKQNGEVAVNNFSLEHMKSRLFSLTIEMQSLTSKNINQQRQFTKRYQDLSEDYKHNIKQYERLQKKIKHFAVADVRKFKEMWLMIEAEVKQIVERALVVDSLICKHHLGLAWERPPMEFMELSGPPQPQKHTWRPDRQAASQSILTMDTSGGPRLETDTESTDTGAEAAQSESGAGVEEGKLSMETLKKVMELLCDEAGFLIEDKLLNLMAPLQTEEQTVLKLSALLCAFGIEEEDVPKLACFLLKYGHQQRERTEDVCLEAGESSDKEVETSSTTHLTGELNPNHVVPALKSFLEQLVRSRESQHPSFQHVEARDASEDEAYWERMGNIISEDKLKLWDATENTLEKYHVVLTEISELVPETQSLQQQNTELRMLLQQSLNSGV